MLTYRNLLDILVEAVTAVKPPVGMIRKFWINSLGQELALEPGEHHYDSLNRIGKAWHTVFGRGWVRAGFNEANGELYFAFDPDALTDESRKGLMRAIRENRPTSIAVDELEWSDPKRSSVLDPKQFRQRFLVQTPE